jgi:protein O-mannosyl-transferase
MAKRLPDLPLAAPPRNHPLRAFLGLILLSLPWTIALSCPFIHLDDPMYVFNNPHVLTGLSHDNIRWAFTNVDTSFYLPLTWLSLMLDATLFGVGPFGFHLTNVLLHVASTLLLFQFLRTATGSLGRAFLVAALFSIHPLRVESVAWVTERKDALFLFFGMLALCAYARYARTAQPGWYVATLLLTAASLLAKATLMTFPALLLLLDFWPLRRTATVRWPRLLLEKIPFALLSAAMIIVTSTALKMTHGAISLPLDQRLANALLSCFLYLRDTFYFGGLSILYPLHLVSVSDAIPAALVLLLLTAAVVIIAVKLPSHGRPALVGWLWFLGTLAPALGFIQSGAQSRGDRFTYFPSIGLFIALIYPWPDRLVNAPARAFYRNIAVGAAIFLCVAYTCLQLSLWRSPAYLYLAGAERTANNWVLLTNAGDALQQQGDLEKAEKAYLASLQINPGFPQTHNNYAMLLVTQRRNAEALEQFRRSLELNPTDPQARANYQHALEVLKP